MSWRRATGLRQRAAAALLWRQHVLDATLLSPTSALLGALIGGSTSLVAAVYTQRRQDRLQRVASEITRRETVYADFVMSASKLLLNAFVHDEIALGAEEQLLLGLVN